MSEAGTGSQHFAVPHHWIGIRKGWLDTCQSIGEALVSVPPDALRTHALVIGATGSGKTVLVHHLTAQDLVNGHGLVVLDARGDLVHAVIELAARAGVSPDLIRVFDLREKIRPLGFSPLAGAGETFFRALGFLDAIAAEWEALGPQTADVMRNAVLLLAEAGAPITDLEPLFYDGKVRLSLIERATSTKVRDFWIRFDELGSDRQTSLASPVLNKTAALFATEGLRRMYGSPNPVDLGAHLNTPGSITLISLAVDELHGAGWMAGSLFLSSISREIFARVEIAESMRVPIRLVVDEFEHFGMREFDNLLAEGRRFRCALLLAHQTLAQLNPKMRSMLLGNVGVKVIFRTSHQDADTLNKDLLGTPKGYDIPALSIGEAVLWRRGHEPFVFEVNEPLITDVSRKSPAARSLLAAIRERIPEWQDVPTNSLEASEPGQRKANPNHKTDLEDWL